MRIGIFESEAWRHGTEGVIAAAENLVPYGFDSFWLPQMFGLDAITMLAVTGRAVPGIPELGTAIVPVWPRHPTSLAAQALAAADATGNRFTLGVGLSHQVVIEGMLQIPWERPATYMDEYLNILAPLLERGRVSYAGDRLATLMRMQIARESKYSVPVLVAALGPRMLELAGRLAQGTATWMTGSKTIANHVTPRIRASANRAKRPAPRIGVGLPICLSSDVAATRAAAAERYAVYGQLPSYRAMLDREGVDGPADVALVGSANDLRIHLESLRDAGTTDLIADVFGDPSQRIATLEFLSQAIPDFR